MTTPETTDTAEQNLTLAWERWWAGIGGTPGEIVWEASPGDLEADLDHFAGWFGQVLPVVDVGCGDGGKPGSWPATFRTWLAWMSRPRLLAGPGPRTTRRTSATKGRMPATRLRRQAARRARRRQRLHPRRAAGPAPRQPPPGGPGHRGPARRHRDAVRQGTAAASLLAYFAALIKRHGLPPGLAKVMRHIPPGHIHRRTLAGAVPRRPLRGDQHRDQPHAHRQHPVRRRRDLGPGDQGTDPATPRPLSKEIR